MQAEVLCGGWGKSLLLTYPSAPGISVKATEPMCFKDLTILLEVTFQRLSPKLCLISLKANYRPIISIFL